MISRFTATSAIVRCRRSPHRKRRPSMNSGSCPGGASVGDRGPPPCTTTGFMPTSCMSTTSVRTVRQPRRPPWPPYLITTVLPRTPDVRQRLGEDVRLHACAGTGRQRGGGRDLGHAHRCAGSRRCTQDRSVVSGGFAAGLQVARSRCRAQPSPPRAPLRRAPPRPRDRRPRRCIDLTCSGRGVRRRFAPRARFSPYVPPPFSEHYSGCWPPRGRRVRHPAHPTRTHELRRAFGVARHLLGERSQTVARR